MVREIKETSTEAKSGLSETSEGVINRKLVFSIQITRSSFRSFQSSCPCPTSILYTLAAPFCSIQSVKPPVEAPISIQTRPFKASPKLSTAFSSFSPPRLTYFCPVPFTSICILFKSKEAPALSSLCPSTKTFPDMMIAFAFSREGASPSLTSNVSKRSFIVRFPFLFLFSPQLFPRLYRFPFSAAPRCHAPHTRREWQSA